MARYCLIGEKLPHTLSPEIHSHFGYEYDVVELCDADAVANFAKNCEYDGFNVTVPYKKEIMKHLSYIHPEALAIGAVNTVKRVGGEWHGYNTDIAGMEYSLKKSRMNITGKNVVILGSGGTRQTAEFLAQKHHAKSVLVVSRNGEINYDNFYLDRKVDFIFNTTPVGTFPHQDESPFDLSLTKDVSGVFDVVYNPQRTNFLSQAKKLGARAENGLRMLVEQARVARDIWMGETSDQKITEEILRNLVSSEQNIVLIGMPACGKSTVGKMVAKHLGKTFVDADAEIVKLAGKSIPDIFAEDGEETFRNFETEALKNLSNRRGIVIATGGGAVLREENRRVLKQSGVVFYLKRDISKLSTYGRPLSKKGSLEEMFKVRGPIYEEFCDHQVSNNGTFTKAAEKIKKMLVCN